MTPVDCDKLYKHYVIPKATAKSYTKSCAQNTIDKSK